MLEGFTAFVSGIPCRWRCFFRPLLRFGDGGLYIYLGLFRRCEPGSELFFDGLAKRKEGQAILSSVLMFLKSKNLPFQSISFCRFLFSRKDSRDDNLMTKCVSGTVIPELGEAGTQASYKG